MTQAAPPPLLCHRYPTRPARRKFYHCHRPICPRCQMRSEGHIFCSDRCIRNHRRKERWQRFSHWNRNALKGWWLRGLFLLALCGGGVGTIWLSARFDRFLYTPPETRSLFPREKVTEAGLDQERLDWDSTGPISIETPSPDSVVTNNRITVTGHAPIETMVGLYVNGQRHDVQMATDGTWTFENVPVPTRLTILQARFFNNRGGSAFSRAVSVNLAQAEAPAPLPPLPEFVPEPEFPAASSLGISRASLDRREILLTFDGGSNANSTPAILDILQAHKIHATVFLTGEFIRRYPELVRRIALEGHTVGNHTATHPHLTSFSFNRRQNTLPGVSEPFLRAQLTRTAGLYQLATDRRMAPYWRAPFGEFNHQILSWAAAAGWRHVYWSPHMDTLDWVADSSSPLYRSPAQILQGLLRQANQPPVGLNGGIVLMHLGTERQGETKADSILEQLVSQLAAQGYTFTTVDRAAIPAPDSPDP